MPTIRHEIDIDVPADLVWDAVRDVGSLHSRLVPGFVTSTEMLESAATPIRRVTFANGVVVDEAIVSIEDEHRRLVWTIVSVEHHNGAMQVSELSGPQSRVVWTADVLPDSLEAQFSPLMAAGLATMKAHLEAETGQLPAD